MGGRRSYTDDTKAAVMAALLAGQSIREVAKEYNIPRSTVGRWNTKLNEAGVPSVPDTKKAEIGDLLVRYLKETLQTLIQQSKFARTVKWLEKQPASELAVLHGVQTDKAIRLLEALSASNDRAPED